MNALFALVVFRSAARLGFKQVFTEPLSLLGGFLIYAVIVIAYAGVFRWIPSADLAAHHLTYAHMVWYLGATELMLFCCSFVHFKELQYAIQSGQMHLSLLRPCANWIVLVGDWSGQCAARFVILLVPSMAVTAFVAGDISLDVGHALGLIVSWVFAAFLLLCSYFFVGISCLWFQQAEPAFWIWQKILFFLGALLWPLAFYPDVLSTLAWFTPFPDMLALTGQWVLPGNGWLLAAGLLHQLFWVLLFAALIARVDRAVLRRIQESGV